MADNRISAKEAGYMDLINAKHDGECEKVSVLGGISLERGCCNLFQPETRYTTRFSCGTCEYQRKK